MRVIEIALKEVGTKENPPESNKVKYNDWIYGKPTQGAAFPWCAAFVSWCFDQAGMNLGKIDVNKGYVGCNFAYNNVSKWGKVVTVPQQGDICFFDWQGDKKFDHTGIFIKDLGNGYFESVEGNTGATNFSNGGEVMICKRKYTVAKFIRPNVLNSQL